MQDRDQDLQAPGAARVSRQERGREADPFAAIARPAVAHARLAHRDRADAGHDRALG